MARYVIIVEIWLRPGQAEAFEAFERDAARLMARQGGRIDHAVRLRDADPFELHIVSFPDEAAYSAYQGDPETLALRPRRDEIIEKWVGRAGVTAGPYA